MTSMTDFLQPRHRNGKQKMTEFEDAPLPSIVNGPRDLAVSEQAHQSPIRRQMSQRVMETAQQWEELEAELTQTKVRLQSACAHIEVLEGTQKVRDQELAQLRADNERLVRENTAIGTRVKAAAELLISICRPATDRSEFVSNAGSEAVEEALGQFAKKQSSPES